jgi:uncharacterized membrane protein
MTRTIFATLIGLALGFALAFGGFGRMLLVALFVAIGLIVGKVLEGDLDLSPYISRRSGR